MEQTTTQIDPIAAHATLDERRWAARRLGNGALLVGVLYGAWWLLITGVILLNAPEELRRMRFGSVEHWVDPVLLAGFLTMGLALRTGKIVHPLALRVLDVVFAVTACLAATAHAWSWALSQPALPMFVLNATYALVLRAALLPGPPKRTLLVGLAGWIAGALALGGIGTPFEAPEPLPQPSVQMVIGALVIWGVVTVGLTGVLSQILHGLRRQVKEAERLGQYAIESKIAEGGMGVVYRARHVLLRRETALKLLKPELSDPVSVKRFEREVTLTSQLRHPNTIAVHDFGRTPDGIFYFAMELLVGVDLQTLVDRHGPLPAPRVLYLFRQVASALSEAHDAGLIHRDIKPSNLFVSSAGPVKDWVKVLDFGLVRQTMTGHTDLSVTGAIVGTPMYMAPEQIKNPNVIDARADLYSLGCTMYFALTATPVFDGGSVIEVCAAHMRDEPVPVSVRAPDVPAEVERMVKRLLEKDPDERIQSAAELVDRIDALLDALPWTARDSVKAWDRAPSVYASRAADPGSKPSGVTVDLAARPDLVATGR